MPLRRSPAGTAAMTGGLLIAIFSLVAVFAVRGYEDRLELVRHSVDVQRRLMTVLSVAQDAETGQRGYLLTGDPDYLSPYQSAARRLDGELNGLQGEVADNPEQRRAAERLQPLVEAKLEELQRTIELLQGGRESEALSIVRSDAGRLAMNRIRATIDEMSARETALLVDRTATSRRYSYGLFGFLSLLTLAIVASLAAWLVQTRNAAEALEASHEELTQANASLNHEAAVRRSAEDQVRQLQKMEAIGQLTGGIAHDFNNMLAVIIGNIEMARRSLDDRLKLESRLANALEASTKAALLTRRLLAFSRQQALEPRTLDLNQLVAGMSDMLLRSLGADVQVETILSGGLWRTWADPAQLESAVLNLAVNARDAMPGGGKLTIETANTHLDEAYAAQQPGVSPGQYVMVSVTDSGEGMTPEVLAKAFDPFFTTKATGKGTGLGLSQIYGFAKQTGGHARIYSELGEGTTVKLYLPRDQRADRPVAPASAVSPAAPPLGSPDRVILVVEDEEPLRVVSVESLRALGYSVRHAADGPAALAVLRELGPVDLLFTDIIMPGMNGRELAEAATRVQPGLRVLYTTGYTRNAVVHNGVVDSGVDLLSKPFTLDQLAARVHAALSEA